jgi:hypothetical protein
VFLGTYFQHKALDETIAPQLDFSQMLFVDFAKTIYGCVDFLLDFLGCGCKLVFRLISTTALSPLDHREIIVVGRTNG